MAKGTIRIEGMDALLRKIDGSAVYGEPFRDWFNDAIDEAHRVAGTRAPGTHIGPSLTKKVMAGPVPLWGVVSTGYEKRGVRTPFVLEAGHRRDPRSGKDVKLHYRSGPRTGKGTRKWLSGVIAIIRRRALKKLPEAEKKIEALFNR